MPQYLIADFSFCSLSLVNGSQKQVCQRLFYARLYTQNHIDHTFFRKILVDFQEQFWASRVFTYWSLGSVWLCLSLVDYAYLCDRSKSPCLSAQARSTKPSVSHLAGKWEANQPCFVVHAAQGTGSYDTVWANHWLFCQKPLPNSPPRCPYSSAFLRGNNLPTTKSLSKLFPWRNFFFSFFWGEIHLT